MADRIPLPNEHRYALRAVARTDLEALGQVRPSVLRALADAGLIVGSGPLHDWFITRAGQERLAEPSGPVRIAVGRAGEGPPSRPSRRRWRR